MLNFLYRGCYAVQWLTMLILMGGIAYVTYGIVSSRYKTWENTYLTDENLPIAFLVPILWFIYSFAIYHYFNEWACRNAYQMNEKVLLEKLVLEVVNLLATLLTTALLTGANKKR